VGRLVHMLWKGEVIARTMSAPRIDFQGHLYSFDVDAEEPVLISYSYIGKMHVIELLAVDAVAVCLLSKREQSEETCLV